MLTNVRKYLCNKITKNKEEISYSELQLIIALGEQCFLNEYVYSLTEEEKVSLKTIIKSCQDNELNESNISILSCYFPLYKLLDQIPSLKSFNSSNQSFKELIELQITEPLKEIELSKNIKKLGSINDDVSQKVKSQYEENPYPRWRYGSHQTNQKISIIQAINTEINPNYIRQSIDDNQYHLQPLRHLWVMAVSWRGLKAVDADTGKDVVVPLLVELNACVDYTAETAHVPATKRRIVTPCLLPPLKDISCVCINSERYYPNKWAIPRSAAVY